MTSEEPQTLEEQDRQMAVLFAAVVRNELEDLHCRELSDDQMRHINTAVRNSVFTVFQALRRGATSDHVAQWIVFQLQTVPDYWEPPQLLEDFTKWLQQERRRRPRASSKKKSD